MNSYYTLTATILNFKFSLPVHGAYKRNWAAVFGVNLILAPITFILNLTILIAFCKVNGKNKIKNYLCRSLWMADMLTGLLSQPAFAALNLAVFHRKKSCTLLFMSATCGYFLVIVSFFGLLAIHIERYLGVFYPFRHNRIKTDTIMITKLILTGWRLSAICLSLCFLTPDLIMFTVFATAVIPLLSCGAVMFKSRLSVRCTG